MNLGASGELAPLSQKRVVNRLLATIIYGAFVLPLTVFTAIGVVLNDRFELEMIVVSAVFIAFPSMISSIPVAWRCFSRPQKAHKASGSAMIAGVMAGPLAIAISALMVFFIFALFELRTAEVFFQAIVLGAITVVAAGVLLGLPTGFIFSLPFIPLVTFGCSRYRGFDVADRTARRIGGWLLLVGVFGAFVAFVLTLRIPGFSLGLVGYWGVALMNVIAGGAIYFRAHMQQRARQRWLESVRAGSVEGWSVFALEESSHLLAELEVPPLFSDDDGKLPEAVLVREVLDREQGAYRTGRRTIPIATVSHL